MIQKYYTKDNFVKSKQDESPKTPYGLALDLAETIIERDDKDNAGMRSLRPGLTDEYTLARALLDVQPYITSLKNDLEEAELNVDANARDASNCRVALEETRAENSKLKGQLEEAVGALEGMVADVEAIYDLCKRKDLMVVSIGQFRRLNEARGLLSKLKEAGS